MHALELMNIPGRKEKRRLEKRTGRWMDGEADRWMDSQMDGEADGWMERQMKGWTDANRQWAVNKKN